MHAKAVAAAAQSDEDDEQEALQPWDFGHLFGADMLALEDADRGGATPLKSEPADRGGATPLKNEPAAQHAKAAVKTEPKAAPSGRASSSAYPIDRGVVYDPASRTFSRLNGGGIRIVHDSPPKPPPQTTLHEALRILFVALITMEACDPALRKPAIRNHMICRVVARTS